jgi:uncharacterized membrane protein YkgB
MVDRIEHFDRRVTRWFATHAVAILRVSLGVVFVWFGAPKLVPGLSPADELVAQTLPWFDPVWLLPSLGLAEIAIGICLLHRPLLRVGLVLMAGHMLGAALPLITLPEVVWKSFPVATLEGQYILKNMVLVGGAIALGATTSRKRRVQKPPSRWVARRVTEALNESARDERSVPN